LFHNWVQHIGVGFAIIADEEKYFVVAIHATMFMETT